jgi:PAS domain S-box-containing protein
MPAMIWCFGSDKLIDFVNQSALDFTGHSMDDELGSGWTRTVHPDDLDRCLATYWSSHNTRRPFRIQCRLRRADGEYRWVVCHGVPCSSDDAGLPRYLTACFDVTEIYQRQEQTLRAEKLESMKQLAGGVAGRVGSILENVHVVASAAGRLDDRSAAQDQLETITRLTSEALQVMRDLKIYAGQERPEFGIVSLSHLVEDALGALRDSIPGNVKIETYHADALPSVRASSTQLQQLVIQLVRNALNAIGEQEGIIAITTSMMTVKAGALLPGRTPVRPGMYMNLEVSDTGCGMSQDVRARIFEPFFPSNASCHIGLAVLDGIVRSHGGVMHVVSATGAGSTFQVLLPLGGEPCPSAATRAKPAPCTAIMVVEDEQTLLAAVTKMLEKSGFSVLAAADGDTAIEHIRTCGERIALLILDVNLPGMPSRNVLQEARRVRPGIPVILTSAFEQDVAEASFTGLPVEHFIRKPYRLVALVNLLERVLSNE